MPKLDDAAAEIRKPYETGSTLKEIAVRFNVSKQAVHYRLKAVGVEFRHTGQTAPFIDRGTLERLYIDKGLSAQQIADHVGCLIGKVYTSLKRHGIDRRERGLVSRKYPQLRELNVGESIEVPRPQTKWKYQSYFYPMARSLGIRVSVRTINEQTVKLTRVE